MKIGINASFCRKPYSGIGQVTFSFLRKLIDQEMQKKQHDHEFILYLEEDLPETFSLPQNFKKEIFLPSYKRDDLVRKIWWEKYLLPCKVKKDCCGVFFSLYQCPTIVNTKMKHLMLVHDLVPKLFPEYLNNWRKKYYQKLTEKAIGKATKIISISHWTKNDLVQYLQVPEERISVNYISIDEIYQKNISQALSDDVLQKYKLKKGYIFAGGGMEVRKNVEGVIRAYKLLLEGNKKKNIHKDLPDLVIYGKLMPNFSLAFDVEKLVHELDLQKYVKLLDTVSQNDLPALFSNALFFVYPSRYEGFGMPVLEAMSQGVPVITTKNSSLPEVGGEAVLYVKSEKTRDIFLAMQELLNDEGLRDDFARKGKKRAHSFSWDKFVDNFYQVIENI